MSPVRVPFAQVRGQSQFPSLRHVSLSFQNQPEELIYLTTNEVPYISEFLVHLVHLGTFVICKPPEKLATTSLVLPCMFDLLYSKDELPRPIDTFKETLQSIGELNGDLDHVANPRIIPDFQRLFHALVLRWQR